MSAAKQRQQVLFQISSIPKTSAWPGNWKRSVPRWRPPGSWLLKASELAMKVHVWATGCYPTLLQMKHQLGAKPTHVTMEQWDRQ